MVINYFVVSKSLCETTSDGIEDSVQRIFSKIAATKCRSRVRLLWQRLLHAQNTYALKLKLKYCNKSNAFADDCTKHMQNVIENLRMHSLQGDYVSFYNWYERSFIYFKLNI